MGFTQIYYWEGCLKPERGSGSTVVLTSVKQQLRTAVKAKNPLKILQIRQISFLITSHENISIRTNLNPLFGFINRVYAVLSKWNNGRLNFGQNQAYWHCFCIDTYNIYKNDKAKWRKVAVKNKMRCRKSAICGINTCAPKTLIRQKPSRGYQTR